MDGQTSAARRREKRPALLQQVVQRPRMHEVLVRMATRVGKASRLFDANIYCRSTPPHTTLTETEAYLKRMIDNERYNGITEFSVC